MCLSRVDRLILFMQKTCLIRIWVFLLTVSQTAAAKATDSASFIVNPSRQFHHRDRRKIIDIMAAHEPIEVEDDEESIDEEQLEDYEDMVEQLGSFPVSWQFDSIYSILWFVF